MAAVKEAVHMRMASNIAAESSGGDKIEYDPIPLDDTDNWASTLKKEIANFTGAEELQNIEKDINDFTPAQIVKQFKNFFADGENVKSLYYIKESNFEEKKYIYDEKHDIVYKIPKTHISVHTVHSVEQLDYLQTGVKPETKSRNYTLISQSDVSTKKVGNVTCYEPDLNNLAQESTRLVFYKVSGSTVTTSTKEITVSKWITDGKPNEITEGTDKYVLYDYENKIWANIKVLNDKGTDNTSDDIETWWVWIPRCAYKNTAETKTTDIAFIDVQGNKLNGEEGEYTTAKAFEGNTRKGIWISKYEHTTKATTDTSEWKYYIPDITGLDKNKTEIALYNDNATSFVEYKKLSEVTNLSIFARDNNWFDYYNQKWANIKIINTKGTEETSDDVETWWVWIPRYAYSNTGGATDIIFIDTDNEPMDGTILPASYSIPKAFEGNTKKGVWVSKYEFTSKTTSVAQNISIVPDLTGLTGTNIEVYLETYNDAKTGFNSNPTKYTSSINLATFASNNNWYDYSQQLWANIKIVNTLGTADTSDDIETWWVWIPRYAYKNTGGATDIILIGTDNKDFNGNALPEGYKVQKAFEGNSKKGAWVNKYEFTEKN